MRMRKRIISFILALLILSSVCYVDAPSTKAINESAKIESFITWYVNTYRPSKGSGISVDVDSINKVLSTEIMGDLDELLVGVANGTVLNTDASIDSILSNAKKTQSGSLNSPLDTGFEEPDWAVLRNAMKQSVAVYRNGGTIPGLTGTNQSSTSSGTVEQQQEIANVMQEAKDILAQYVYTDLGCGDQLDAAAWVVCQEINAMKAKGFSDLAIIGAMCNMKTESGFDPYMIQDGIRYAFDEFIMTSSDIMLKLDGKNPLESTTKEEIESKITSADRINFTVTYAPTKGIGLFQFTDCSTTDRPNYNQLMSGYRRSCAINEFMKFTEDPWTCILGCGNYNYWISPVNIDNSTTGTSTNEDGSTNTFEYNVAYESKLCNRSESLTTIPLAAADVQIGFFTELDGPRCWRISQYGKGYMETKGFEAYKDFTFEDYKNFQGTGNATEDARVATLLFLLGVERPGATAKGYDGITGALNERCDADVITAVSKIGGFNGYEGLNLDAIAYNSTFNTNGFSYENILNGTGTYTHLRALAQSGYYTSSELSQACACFEGNVESELLALADRSYMTRKELYNLIAWEDQVRTTSLESNLIMLGRQITLWTGIMIMVWSVLFYLAYWLDRLNTMFYLDFVGILSFKKLQASDAPENSTYNLTKEELGYKRVRIVVHKDVIKISILGVAVGTIFATGSIFNILNGFMMWLYNFLS